MLESLINFLRIKLKGEKNIKEDILEKKFQVFFFSQTLVCFK
jgi:hypothetical protein